MPCHVDGNTRGNSIIIQGRDNTITFGDHSNKVISSLSNEDIPLHVNSDTIGIIQKSWCRSSTVTTPSITTSRSGHNTSTSGDHSNSHTNRISDVYIPLYINSDPIGIKQFSVCSKTSIAPMSFLTITSHSSDNVGTYVEQ